MDCLGGTEHVNQLAPLALFGPRPVLISRHFSLLSSLVRKNLENRNWKIESSVKKFFSELLHA